MNNPSAKSINEHKPALWQLGLGFTAGVTAVLFGPPLAWIVQRLVGIDVYLRLQNTGCSPTQRTIG